MSLKSHLTKALLAGLLIASVCLPQAPALAPSQSGATVMSDTLTAAVLVAPGTYFTDGRDTSGLELDLLNHFARHNNKVLNIQPVRNRFEAYALLREGAIDVAVGLYRGRRNSREFWMGPGYLNTQDVVLVKNKTGFSQLTDVSQKSITLSSQESLDPLLKLHASKTPEPFAWLPQQTLNTELLNQLSTGQLISAVMPAHEFQRLRHYFPEIRMLITLPEEHSLAWATHHKANSSLRKDITEFFATIRSNGKLKNLITEHFSHLETFDYVEAKIFTDRIKNRLPKYRPIFREAGEQFNFDWRLLAAVSHQESQWVPTAKSPTGVRGLMMLTQATAKDLGVKNRLDPRQSIIGGSEYLRSLHKRLPKSITGDDRMYMALAAYNVGLGHLLDARRITQKRNGNPNIWLDVRKSLPLLADKKWAKQTRYGLARGHEPVRYVSQIRRYYDWLVWHDANSSKQATLADSNKRSTPLETSQF